MLIRNQAEQQTADVAACNAQFSFQHVRERLQTECGLDSLSRSLDRDYALFSYLLEHAAGLKATSIEDRLLVLDYKVMQGWYRLTKSAAPQQARQALEEMASVLGILVGNMGERAVSQRAV